MPSYANRWRLIITDEFTKKSKKYLNWKKKNLFLMKLHNVHTKEFNERFQDIDKNQNFIKNSANFLQNSSNTITFC